MVVLATLCGILSRISCVQRLSTFFSLLQQKSFTGASQSYTFASAAATTFFLLLSDLWSAFLFCFVLITCVRAPYLIHAVFSLQCAYAKLWQAVRLQTDDAHYAQITQIIHEQASHSSVSVADDSDRIDDLCHYATTGLNAFLLFDASSARGGGLVHASSGNVNCATLMLPSRLVFGGGTQSELDKASTSQLAHLHVVPRSFTLFRPLIYAEARWVSARLHHIVFSPLKLVGALCIPIVMYLRWRLSPPSEQLSTSLELISNVWYRGLRRGGQPPAAMSLEALKQARVEIMLRSSPGLGVCFRALHWLIERVPATLEFWTMERYAICAMLALPLLLLNDLACCLALRVHAIIAIFTGGFGRIWGDANTLLGSMIHNRRLQVIDSTCMIVQGVVLPILLCLEACFVLLPPLFFSEAFAAWLIALPAFVARANDVHATSANASLLTIVPGNASTSSLDNQTALETPNGSLTAHIAAFAPAVAASPPWLFALASVWWLSALLSWEFMSRSGRDNALWRPTGLWCAILRPRIPRPLVIYLRLLAYLTHLNYQIRDVFYLGEIGLVPVVIVWVGWPVAIPLLLNAYLEGDAALGWLTLAAPVTLVLLVLATRVLRKNWSEDPAYIEDIDEEHEQADARLKARHTAFMARRHARINLERTLMESSLRALPISKRVTAEQRGPHQPFFSTPAARPLRWVELKRNDTLEAFGLGFDVDDTDGHFVVRIDEIEPGTPAATMAAKARLHVGMRLEIINDSEMVPGVDLAKCLASKQRTLTLGISTLKPAVDELTDAGVRVAEHQMLQPAQGPRWSRDHVRSHEAEWAGVVIPFGDEVSKQIEDALQRARTAWPLGDGFFIELDQLWDVDNPTNVHLALSADSPLRHALPETCHFAIRHVEQIGTHAAAERPARWAHRVAQVMETAYGRGEEAVDFTQHEEWAWGEDDEDMRHER